MARFSFVVFALVFGASTSYALSNSVGHRGGHDKLAHSHGSINLTERMGTMQRDWKLGKRFDGARFTNYEAGMGACGKTNSNSDFIVALNSEQYGNGEHCFGMITITYNGKSTQAQITDECPSCPFGALDLTPSLFQYFASLDDGVIYGSWSFGSGASSSSSSSSSSPTPTTTWHPQTTSSTWTPETTSWSSTSTWSSSSSTSTWSSSSSSTATWSSTSTSSSMMTTSTPTSASATPSVDASSALEMLNYGFVQLGGLISGAAQVNLNMSESS